MSQVLRHSFLAVLAGVLLLSAFDARAADQYRRWLNDGKTYTCTNTAGTVTVNLSNQNVEFNNLPADAQYTINYIKNGVTNTDGPYTVEQTTGTRNYGAFSTTFAGYPLSFVFRLDTLINGRVVYQSAIVINCAADTTAATAVSFSNLDLAVVTSVPTLDGLGLALLALCVGIIGFVVARLRRS